MGSPFQQPSTIPPCPACGGQRIGAPCYEGALGRRVWQSGTAHVSALRVLACINCGQATLYVADMEAFKKALQKYPEGFTY